MNGATMVSHPKSMWSFALLAIVLVFDVARAGDQTPCHIFQDVQATVFRRPTYTTSIAGKDIEMVRYGLKKYHNPRCGVVDVSALHHVCT